MGIFNFFKKDNEESLVNYSKEITIESILSEDYVLKNKNFLDDVWVKDVPKKGKAKLQGAELLRELEALRWSCQNSNVWKKEYDDYCDNIKETLLKEKLFTLEDRDRISIIMDEFKSLNVYNDELYDVIADYIAEYIQNNPNEIYIEK